MLSKISNECDDLHFSNELTTMMLRFLSLGVCSNKFNVTATTKKFSKNTLLENVSLHMQGQIISVVRGV